MNTNFHTAEDIAAIGLRNQGFTYGEIAQCLSMSVSGAWRACNRERARVSACESSARYRARGCKALADC
jgi:hypothetical protein